MRADRYAAISLKKLLEEVDMGLFDFVKEAGEDLLEKAGIRAKEASAAPAPSAPAPDRAGVAARVRPRRDQARNSAMSIAATPASTDKTTQGPQRRARWICAASLRWGKGRSFGTGTPRKSQSGSQPCFTS